MLRGLWVLLVLIVMTAVAGIPAILHGLVRRDSDVSMRLGALWSRALLAASGTRVTYRNLERMTSHLPCIFLANHRSNVDIWALIKVLPYPARFVAKESLFRIPVLGWAMSAAGFIPIDRANRGRAMNSLKLAAEKVRAGRPVVLFPEGTDFHTAAGAAASGVLDRFPLPEHFLDDGIGVEHGGLSVACFYDFKCSFKKAVRCFLTDGPSNWAGAVASLRSHRGSERTDR